MRFLSDVLTSDRKSVRVSNALPSLWCGARSIQRLTTFVHYMYSINSVFDLFSCLHASHQHATLPYYMLYGIIYWAHLSNEDKWLFSLNYTLHKYIEWKLVICALTSIYYIINLAIVSFYSIFALPLPALFHDLQPHICIRHFISQCNEDNIE